MTPRTSRRKGSPDVGTRPCRRCPSRPTLTAYHLRGRPLLSFRQCVAATMLIVAAACGDSNGPGSDPGPGRLAFTRAGNSLEDIYAVALRGSNLQQLTTSLALDDWVAWSPDTTRILFQSDTAADTSSVHFHVFIMNSDGSHRAQLTFDTASYHPAWSPDGARIVFGSKRDDVNGDIYTMDPNGSNVLRITTNTAADGQPAWAPNGNRIAFATDRDANAEVYVMDPDGANPINLTNDPSTDLAPAWSPDGSKIAFQSDRLGDFAVWVMNADGSNPVRLTDPSPPSGAPSWSPDGTRIAYEQGGDIWIMNVDGSRKIRITSGFWADGLPRWRPIL